MIDEDVINPELKVINGSGKPRIIVETAAAYATKGATTFTDTGYAEADGATKTIDQILVADADLPCKIRTTAVHGLAIGDFVVISGSNSTPVIDGTRQVIYVSDTTHFSVEVTVTSAGSAGSCHRTADAELNGIEVGMMAEAVFHGADSLLEVTYGKIISLDGNSVEIDAWTGGTPSTNDVVTVKNLIIDLPYCGEKQLTEKFTPNQIVQSLYRGRKAVKFYGYDYEAALDYSIHIFGQTIQDLSPVLNSNEDRSIVLIPRVDAPEHAYNVYLKTTPIELSMFGNAQGHRKFKLEFIGTEIVPDTPITLDYGTLYSTGSYGDNL